MDSDRPGWVWVAYIFPSNPRQKTPVATDDTVVFTLAERGGEGPRCRRGGAEESLVAVRHGRDSFQKDEKEAVLRVCEGGRGRVAEGRMSARGKMVPAPPSDGRRGAGAGGGRGRKMKGATPRGATSAALFAEVFGGGGAEEQREAESSREAQLPSSVSPPFEEEEEVRGRTIICPAQSFLQRSAISHKRARVHTHTPCCRRHPQAARRRGSGR